MKMRRAFRRGVIGAMMATLGGLTFLAGCGGQAPPTPVPLRVGLLGSLAELPYFVTRSEGFDKRHGLQFEEKSYPGGLAMIEALAAGSLDVGYDISVWALLAAAERGLVPGTLLAVAANTFTDPDHPANSVLAAPSIRTWKDLRGKQIAVHAINSMTGAAIQGRLRHEGVQDYKLEEISFANMGLAVAGGNVAAATMVEPFLTQSLLRGDGKVLGAVIGGPPFERIEFTTIVFRADFYRNNPRAVKTFLRAHLQAVRWLDKNPEKARAILAKRLDLSQEVGQKMRLLRWPADGRNDPALVESLQPPLVDVGLLKAPVPAARLYDEQLLNEVLAEK